MLEFVAVINCFYTQPYPVKSFTLKAPRVHYVTGSKVKVAKLLEIPGRES